MCEKYVFIEDSNKNVYHVKTENVSNVFLSPLIPGAKITHVNLGEVYIAKITPLQITIVDKNGIFHPLDLKTCIEKNLLTFKISLNYKD